MKWKGDSVTGSLLFHPSGSIDFSIEHFSCSQAPLISCGSLCVVLQRCWQRCSWGKRYFRSIIVVISGTLCSTNGGTCWTVRAHSGRSLLPLTKASCCCCLLVRVLTLCIYSVFVMRLKLVLCCVKSVFLAFTVNPILTFSDTSTYLKSSMHQANTDQEAPFYLQETAISQLTLRWPCMLLSSIHAFRYWAFNLL